ncbi:MAG: glycosyltransferase [Candidatus Pelagibacter sp.]
MKFSIVIPLYNEADNINQLNSELLNAINDSNNNNEFEIIYVEDGSSDKTLDHLKKLNNKIKTIIVKNDSNLAQSKSILNGIEVSNFNNIILLDGDLQNDPKDINKMIEIYNNKENILVHGFRKNRNDPYLTKILPSKIANFIVRKFTNSKILDHGCSLKIFDKRMIDTNDFFGDFHRLFAAQISKDIEVIEIEVNHRPRIKGKSNYGFERVIRVLIDLIFMNFSKKERSSFYTLGTLGLISFFFSFVSLIYMFFLKIIENKSFIETPLPMVFVFFTLSGFIFFSLNLVLETMKKIINSNSKGIKTYKIVK